MTDRIQWAMTPRDRQLEVAKKELVNFEKRENAFRMKIAWNVPWSCGFPLRRSKFSNARSPQCDVCCRHAR